MYTHICMYIYMYINVYYVYEFDFHGSCGHRYESNTMVCTQVCIFMYVYTYM